MIFVDANVFMYAVGREHPLKSEARGFFRSNYDSGRLVTSAEVLQELMHAYLPVQRVATLDAALALVEACVGDVWPVERQDVELGRALLERHPELTARDLLHLASCRRRKVYEIKSYDRGLNGAFRR